MKPLFVLLVLASEVLAAPFTLTKHVEFAEVGDSKCVYTTYKDGDRKVFVSSVRTSVSGAFIFQSELYYFEGKVVYLVSRSADSGIGVTFTQYPELKGLQISIADSDRDGLPDSVLLTGELGEIGFQRTSNGEMVPISPLIVDEGAISKKNE